MIAFILPGRASRLVIFGLLFSGVIWLLMVGIVSAHWPQRGGEMLFWIGQEGLFTLHHYDVGHQLLAPVTPSPNYRFLNPPMLSPTGRYVIYEVDREGDRAILVINTSGEVIYESSRDEAVRLPVWSPLEDEIAYWATSDGFWHFYMMKPDGSDIRSITDQVGLMPYTYPLWAPDGRHIFFKLWAARFGATMYMVDVASGETENVTPLLSASGDLGWSPDGRYLIYRSERDRNGEIYRLEVDNDQITNLTQNKAIDFQPNWSPDGSQISFVSTRNDGGEIHVMAADGSDVRQISDGGGWLPQWSPDGRWIAYISRRDGGDSLYITPAEGGQPQWVAHLNEQHQFLGWFETIAP